MKKLFVIITATLLAACNGAGNSNSTNADTSGTTNPAGMDTSSHNMVDTSSMKPDTANMNKMKKDTTMRQ